MPTVETVTPPGTPTPIGPYSHVARAGDWVTIGGTAGVDPSTGQLAGNDVESQTRQILQNFAVMLAAVGPTSTTSSTSTCSSSTSRTSRR
jgi:2-iminobutanoate/2-iminopropanoate deaminase